MVIICGSEVIARHQRSYEREAVVFDPLHYLALLEQKTRALEQARRSPAGSCPSASLQLRRLLEARLKKHGSREYVQVLRLLETFASRKCPTPSKMPCGWARSASTPCAIMLLCRIERRPPRLDMENYPHLPLAQVRTTRLPTT